MIHLVAAVPAKNHISVQLMRRARVDYMLIKRLEPAERRASCELTT
jgi:hypothetical protein